MAWVAFRSGPARNSSLTVGVNATPASELHNVHFTRDVHIRQFSAHQPLRNHENNILHYAMRDRLTALGWSSIETIYEDLGRSAADTVACAGFDGKFAELCFRKVGAVASQEMSRFARTSRD